MEIKFWLNVTHACKKQGSEFSNQNWDKAFFLWSFDKFFICLIIGNPRIETRGNKKFNQYK